MVAEYLPGRDFACQTLWVDGALVLVKTTERLAYVDGASRLSGTSSVASLHKTVRDERLVDIVKHAVLAVDKRASGAFSIDLKENAEGQPAVTEINAGRLLSGTTIFDVVGQYNMSATYIRLGVGQDPAIRDIYDSAEGHYVCRDLDTPPHVFDRIGFWEGWVDARV
jgi:carbamoyl-phosphate synthase large subunit